MIALGYVSEDVVASRHAAVAQRHRAGASAGKKPPPRQRNVVPVLSLDETVYFQFRGRAYGVPPLPWRAGQQIVHAYTSATIAAAECAVNPQDADALQQYYAALSELPKLLWRHCRVVGRWRRIRRTLGMLRNPFEGASEGELLEHADFFCSRRMKSGVRLHR